MYSKYLLHCNDGLLLLLKNRCTPYIYFGVVGLTWVVKTVLQCGTANRYLLEVRKRKAPFAATFVKPVHKRDWWTRWLSPVRRAISRKPGGVVSSPAPGYASFSYVATHEFSCASTTNNRMLQHTVLSASRSSAHGVGRPRWWGGAVSLGGSGCRAPGSSACAGGRKLL